MEISIQGGSFPQRRLPGLDSPNSDKPSFSARAVSLTALGLVGTWLKRALSKGAENPPKPQTSPREPQSVSLYQTTCF